VELDRASHRSVRAIPPRPGLRVGLDRTRCNVRMDAPSSAAFRSFFLDSAGSRRGHLGRHSRRDDHRLWRDLSHGAIGSLRGRSERATYGSRCSGCLQARDHRQESWVAAPFTGSAWTAGRRCSPPGGSEGDDGQRGVLGPARSEHRAVRDEEVGDVEGLTPLAADSVPRRGPPCGPSPGCASTDKAGSGDDDRTMQQGECARS